MLIVARVANAARHVEFIRDVPGRIRKGGVFGVARGNEIRIEIVRLRRTGQIVSKERVQQAVASPEQDVTPNAVEVQISRLRAKLGDAAVIRSLRGLGYRLEEAKSA